MQEAPLSQFLQGGEAGAGGSALSACECGEGSDEEEPQSAGLPATLPKADGAGDPDGWAFNGLQEQTRVLRRGPFLEGQVDNGRLSRAKEAKPRSTSFSNSKKQLRPLVSAASGRLARRISTRARRASWVLVLKGFCIKEKLQL